MAMTALQQAYDELAADTLTRGDATFIHQHVVDATAAQVSDENDKPIRLTFALVGLYLHIEKQFTGKEVQLAHMKLGRRRQPWPVFYLPPSRGAITVNEVMAAPAGPERDKMIYQWCVSVWEAFCDQRSVIIKLLIENQIL